MWDVGLYNPNNLGNFYIQYGYGNGTFGRNQTGWHWGIYPQAQLFTGDFNGDNLWDIGLYLNGSFRIQYGNGNGTFGNETSWPWAHFPTAKVFSGDFNGDGLWDVGLYNPNNAGYFYIQYGNGNGFFGGQTAWQWGYFPNAKVISGDFNNDAKWDIGLYDLFGQGNIYINHGNGQGTFSNQRIFRWTSTNSSQVYTGKFRP